MWILASSVLLSTFVVIGLSSPLPDHSEYKIPEVGTGDRSQYYVLHTDGTFKYGFDTGDGAFESTMSQSLGERGGNFGYVDPDGRTIKLEYEAGRGGFVARGDHLPKASPELAQALAAVVKRTQPFVDPLAGVDSDRSYGFRFQSEDHSRNEQSNSDGTVTGSYSYVDENGVKRSFTYRAGKGIGFVIEGDGLTQDVRSAPAVKQPTFRTTPPRTQTTHSTHSSRRAHIPSRSHGSSFRSSTGSFSGSSANIKSTRSQTPGDASYSFSYSADDHSRSEKSDSDLNVDGKFSFVADDGNRRTLNYVAGSSTGFQAVGDHLPKAPEVDFGSRISSGNRRRIHSQQTTHTRNQHQSAHKRPALPSSTRSSTRGTLSQTYQTPQVHTTKFRSSIGSQRQHSGSRVSHGSSSVHRSSGLSPFTSGASQRASGHGTTRVTTGTSHAQTFPHSSSRTSSFRQSQTSSTSPRQSEEANIRSSFSPQGPYSFSYETSSHSRSESGDKDNNVVGDFKFVAEDDGIRREVKYEAGSETGFIAEGVHLPIGPVVPGSPSGQPTGRLVRVPSKLFVDPLADTDTDASYKFGFDSDTYSRSETADEDGNIVGTYSIVEEDGTKITYRFRAGKGIGFETEEISRTKGPRPAKPIPYSGPLAGSFPSTQTTGQTSSFRVGQTGTQSSFKRGQTGLQSTFRTSHLGQPASRGGQTSHRTGHQSSFGTSHSGQQTSRVGQTNRRTGFQSTVGTSRTSHQTFGAGQTGHRTSVKKTNFRTPVQGHTSFRPQHSSTHSGSRTHSTKPSFKHSSTTRTQSGTGSSFTPASFLRSSLAPTHSEQVFPGFTLHRYEPSVNAEKFGYVLKFDN